MVRYVRLVAVLKTRDGRFSAVSSSIRDKVCWVGKKYTFRHYSISCYYYPLFFLLKQLYLYFVCQQLFQDLI